MKKFSKATKNTIAIMILGMCISTVIFTLADAADSGNALKESDTTTEVKLTSEEIDKIIEDLKVSTNIDNVLEKLDEITQRAELSGNDSLKEYATNTKQKYELQKQLDTVNSLIEAMKKKNSDIDALDNNLKKILAVSTLVEDLQGAVSDETLLLLESLDEENVKALQTVIAEIEGLVDMNDVRTLTLKDRTLLDILILYELINQELLNENRVSVAQEAMTTAVTILKSYEKQKYSTNEYQDLVDGSDVFANKGKKSSNVLPEQVIFLDGAFNMKRPPIMYDGHILVAVDDLYQYIDSKIEYMYNNPTMIIQSEGKTLEITSGKNEAYLNDKPVNMPVPIMNIDETIYMSAEFFAETYDISYRYIQDHETIIMYHNLNQLKIPSTPNQINKD